MEPEQIPVHEGNKEPKSADGKCGERLDEEIKYLDMEV
jgi:hypothetical protein